MGELFLRETGIEEERNKAKKESEVLLDYTRKALLRLTFLKKCVPIVFAFPFKRKRKKKKQKNLHRLLLHEQNFSYCSLRFSCLLLLSVYFNLPQITGKMNVLMHLVTVLSAMHFGQYLELEPHYMSFIPFWHCSVYLEETCFLAFRPKINSQLEHHTHSNLIGHYI